MYPVLFHIGSVAVNSYAFFNTLALIAGSILYFNLTKDQKKLQLEETMVLFAGALAGGFLGAKTVSFLLDFRTISTDFWSYLTQQAGSRSVLGGVVGGYWGVIAAKKLLGIKEKTGDPFALALILAMGIGRIGCFLGGCCYGQPYNGWLSVYLHGQRRYPTQLMEMIFDFTLFLLLWRLRDSMRRPGDLFKLFVFCYALFRFGIEFIRTEPIFWQGLTVYQLIALPLAIYAGGYFYGNYFRTGREMRRKHGGVVK